MKIVQTSLKFVYRFLFSFKMSVNLEIQNFHKICRLCLNFGDLEPIQHEKHIHLIKTLINIEIKENDNFPRNICKVCIKQVENIICFIDTCKSTYETLNNIVSQAEHTHERISDDQLSDANADSKSCSSKIGDSVIFKEEDDSSDTNSRNFETQKESPAKNIENLFDIIKKGHIKTEVDHEQKFVSVKEIKNKRKYLCNYCGKNYTRKNGLDRHIMSHTGVKPFECKECGKCYSTKDTLKTHILIHTGMKTHKCEVCQKSFIQSSHLNYHMRRHAGEKPHSCSFCGKRFLSTYHLERHKLMHTGVKPFKCDLCNKQFVRSTTLRDHLLLHTGERPFQCQHCGKQFNRKQTLTNHVNLVHLEEGTNPINNNYTAHFFLEENIPKLEYI